ncbi:MAG: hypothetical protein IJX16_07500 [Clostridia bacterium]|nr:hypothetical protein [Clostridia bacterium]MBQ8427583.1 hypothetical protein [Clostridia bacterium]
MIITPEEYKPGTVASIQAQKRGRGNPKTKTKTVYKDVLCAFDIETSRLPDIEQSIMYVWMFHIHHHFTIVGRTWEQFHKLIQQINSELGGETLCVFVHNLSYEFQFLQAVYKFDNEEVFAVDRRKVLKCTMYDRRIEYRCSYLHSNMSLAEYTKKMKVEHQKLDGDEFDYKEIRYPWTELTPKQLQYCVHDVIGLCEAIETEMQADGDNLYTFPLTSTGYVRRDAKKAMRAVHPSFVKSQLPNLEVYTLCREAFRGGDTHANRYYSGRILKDVKSADRSSSYPDVVCNCEFPVSEFFHADKLDFDELMHLITVRKKAVLMRVSITNLRLTDELWGAPYLSRDKCRRIERGAYDNGRILSADYLETTITDIDLRIILDQYTFDDMCAFDVAYARYGKLPQSLINETINYYRAKTELKNVPGQDIYYMKSKNKLNSIYGMMAQDPVKQSTIFTDGDWSVGTEPVAELLDKSNAKNFLCYQWGVWVTAHARAALQAGIKLAGDNFVYCDTDSVKYIGEIDWGGYNAERVKASKKSGAFATDPNGVTHYMGVYEDDGYYAEFKTLGAKKYAYTYEPGGKTCVTIAGVTKRKGGAELDKYGGLKAFSPGFVFTEAGGTESIYNDHPEIGVIEQDGHKILITPNVVIKDSTYTLGITAEYESLLENSRLPLDFWAGL